MIEDLFWRLYFFSPERIIAREVKRVGEVPLISDMGCGRGELIKRLRKLLGNFDQNSIGLDIFLPGLIELKKDNVYSWLIQADIGALPFKAKSLDVVIASHVVEHVDKEALILPKLESVCKKLLIVYTPLGYTRFSMREDREDNIYQKHRSGYDINDFKSSGFAVYGIGSRLICNRLYKEEKLPIFIRPLFSFSSILVTAITYFLPRFADHLLCVKRIGRYE